MTGPVDLSPRIVSVQYKLRVVREVMEYNPFWSLLLLSGRGMCLKLWGRKIRRVQFRPGHLILTREGTVDGHGVILAASLIIPDWPHCPYPWSVKFRGTHESIEIPRPYVVPLAGFPEQISRHPLREGEISVLDCR